MKVEARPWNPTDIIDDLQKMIDEEPDRYLNDRRTTLCMARDYLKEYFSLKAEKPKQLPCYLPEENNPYPLCQGRGMKACARCCLWEGYAPEEDEGRVNPPLPERELRGMVGEWVWVVVDYEHTQCDGWALVTTPAFVSFLDQTLPIDFYGVKFKAYRWPLGGERHE